MKLIEEHGAFLRALSALSNILTGDDECFPQELLQKTLGSDLQDARLLTEVLIVLLEHALTLEKGQMINT
jgi:hypothetical protein